MFSKQDKLLRAILEPSTFTARELAKATHVNLNTVRSWLQGQLSAEHPIVEVCGRKPATGRGQPQLVWRKTPSAEERIRDGMVSFGDVIPRESKRPGLRVLDMAQKALEAYAEDPSTDKHLDAAIAWHAQAEKVAAFGVSRNEKLAPEITKEIGLVGRRIQEAQSRQYVAPFVDDLLVGSAVEMGHKLYTYLSDWVADANNPAARRSNPLCSEDVRVDAPASQSLCLAAQRWPTELCIKFTAAALVALNIYCQKIGKGASAERDTLAALWTNEIHFLTSGLVLENVSVTVHDSFFPSQYLSGLFEERFAILVGCTVLCDQIRNLGAPEYGTVGTDDRLGTVGSIHLVETLGRVAVVHCRKEPRFAPPLYYVLSRFQPRTGLDLTLQGRVSALPPWHQLKSTLVVWIQQDRTATQAAPPIQDIYLGDRRMSCDRLIRDLSSEKTENSHASRMEAVRSEISTIIKASRSHDGRVSDRVTDLELAG